MKCDLNTRMLASNYFDFVYEGHHELKGKSISIPFFEPVDPMTKFDFANKKVLKPDYFLQLHQNPMNIERNSEVAQIVRTLGFRETLDEMISEIIDYFTDL